MHCPLDALPARADHDNEIDDDGDDDDGGDDDGGVDDDADGGDDDEQIWTNFKFQREKSNATIQHTLYM